MLVGVGEGGDKDNELSRSNFHNNYYELIATANNVNKLAKSLGPFT